MSRCDTSRAHVPTWNSNTSYMNPINNTIGAYQSDAAQSTVVKYARIINGQDPIGYKKPSTAVMETQLKQVKMYRAVIDPHQELLYNQNIEKDQSSYPHKPISKMSVNFHCPSTFSTRYSNMGKKAQAASPLRKVPPTLRARIPCSTSQKKNKKPYDQNPCDGATKTNLNNVKARVNTFIGRKPKIITDEKNKSNKQDEIVVALNVAMNECSKNEDEENRNVPCFDSCYFENSSNVEVDPKDVPFSSTEPKDTETHTKNCGASQSLPICSLPKNKLVHFQNDKQQSLFNNGKSVMIREVITYRSSQEVNIKYKKRENIDFNGSTELKTTQDKITNSVPSHSDFFLSESNLDLHNAEWTSPESFHELLQPSIMFRHLNSREPSEASLLSNQFHRELQFIVAFLESLHYLENNKISKYLKCSSTEEQKEFNNNLQISQHSLSKQCDILNDIAKADGTINSIKCLDLLSMLLKDECSRTKNLLQVFKKREQALFDHTKSQIIDYEQKKKKGDNKLSVYKKKIRGSLVKLQQEYGQMERMKKALVSISERRKTALLQTKKTIETRLRQSHLTNELESCKPAKSANKKNLFIPEYDLTRCFDEIISMKVDSSIDVDRSKEDLKCHSDGKCFENRILASETSANQNLSSSDSSQKMDKKSDSNVVNVDGEYLNIVFKSAGLPSVFCSGRDYEINETALTNLLKGSEAKSTEEKAVESCLSEDGLERTCHDTLTNNSNHSESSASTARSLVDELHEYFMKFGDEERNLSDAKESLTNRDFDKLVECADKSLQQVVNNDPAEVRTVVIETHNPNVGESFEDTKYLENILSENNNGSLKSDYVMPSKVNSSESDDLKIASMKTCLEEFFDERKDDINSNDYNENSEELLDVHNLVERGENASKSNSSDSNTLEYTMESYASIESGTGMDKLDKQQVHEELETHKLSGGRETSDKHKESTEHGILEMSGSNMLAEAGSQEKSEGDDKSDKIGEFIELKMNEMKMIKVADDFSFGESTITEETTDEEDIAAEAEELRQKQIALEMEILVLEQQSQMYMVRPIPDKPPPPYTWPDKDESSEFQRNIDNVIRYAKIYTECLCKGSIDREEVIRRAKGENVYTTESFDDFLHEFIISAKEKYKVMPGNPWDSSCLITSHIQRESIETKIERAIRDVLGGSHMEPSDPAKSIDQIDEILFKEWKEYENVWSNLERDEIEVKNQLSELVMCQLLDETINEYINFKSGGLYV